MINDETKPKDENWNQVETWGDGIKWGHFQYPPKPEEQTNEKEKGDKEE